tara:strand:+ start:264 stop:389 length:126 start_codon:yes stop_codon:yes gene_type:complete
VKIKLERSNKLEIAMKKNLKKRKILQRKIKEKNQLKNDIKR